MELYQIRYFLAVSRTLNFTHAAADCNVSQPALTRAIQKLEAELGGDLFRRERRRTHLTELGRAMVPLLQQSLDSAEMAKEQAEGYGRGDIAPLRLGLSESVPVALFADVLRELLSAYPGLHLELSRASGPEIMSMLENGELEIAVTGMDRATWERFDGWPLFDEGFLLCLAPDAPLAGKDRVALQALADLPMVGRTHCENTARVAESLANLGVETDVRHSLDSEQDFMTVVASGIGAGLAPASVARDVEGVRTVVVDGLDQTRTVTLYAVAGRRHSSAAAGLIRLARAAEWEAA